MADLIYNLPNEFFEGIDLKLNDYETVKKNKLLVTKDGNIVKFD